MPSVSVIIPVYNQAKRVGECLQSIFKQTFKDFEVIVVNDGSTDNLAKALRPYLGKFRLISQKNRGAAAARNAGYRLSTGKYLLFCDADIVLKPQMLEKMVKTLEQNPQAAYVYSSYKFGGKLFKGWPFDAEKLKKINFAHTTSLIRRERFCGFDEKLKRFQDWDLWLTMSARGERGVWLPEVLFTVKAGGTMSFWLPKFMYRFSWLPAVARYRAAEKIIRQKHHLN